MDSHLDCPDHVASSPTKDVNQLSQKFSFLTTILQFFRLLLEIFKIFIGKVEDTECTSDFMLYEDVDFNVELSDAVEQEDSLKISESSISPCLTKALKTNKDYEDQKIKSSTTTDACSSLKRELKINKEYAEQKIKSTTSCDTGTRLNTELKTNKDYSGQKIKSCTTTDAGYCLKTELKTDKDNADQKIKSSTTKDAGSCLKTELKTNKDYAEQKIKSSTTTDAGSCLKTELKTNKDYEEQKIKSSTTTDAGSCLKTELKTNKDYAEQKIKSSTTIHEGSCLKTELKTNKDYADQKIKSSKTTEACSCLKTELKTNKDYAEQKIKSSTTPDAGYCLKTELKTNEDYAELKTKSTTTTHAGKQGVRDEYSNGQNRSAQLEQEVKMAATSYKVGSLNDLDKDSKADKRTKGSTPNILTEKNESCWADAVEEEECIIAGVGSFMCNLFEKQLYTDVTFYFKETKSFFSAHRVVLAARCDYFEKLLFGKQMNDAIGMEMHVQINDVPLPTFTSIVKYLYTDAVKLEDDCDVLETYRAAKKYRIHQLISACKVYINSIELTENNACYMLELSTSKTVFELKRRCIRYIQNNTSQVFRSKDFERCCYSTVREICQQDALNLNSEGELLEAILLWIDLQKTSKQGKEDFRRGLLKRVRFLRFSPREFSEVLQKHPSLLTPEEGLKILMALNNPCPDSLNNLPKWCNKQVVRRTVQAGQTSIPKSVAGQGDKRWINITLKSLEKRVQTSSLTCMLHLKCLDGIHNITRIKFFLDNVAAEGCTFYISVTVTPDGISFCKTHLAKSRESSLIFENPIAVQAGQTFEMEARFESQQRCQFFQFDKWYSDHMDFMCYFISEPMIDRLYFISGIQYEPV